MTAQLTHSQALSRLSELKAMFLEILSEEVEGTRQFFDGGWDCEIVYEIETHLSIEEWLNELCAREPEWQADWTDIYLQLRGENVEPWLELKRIVESL